MTEKLIVFKSILIRCEVTAVKFCNSYIFAGIGGFLHIFECSSQELLQKQLIFEGQKIYDIFINTNNTELLIYGGKSIGLIEIIEKNDDKGYDFQRIKIKVIADWIMRGIFVESDSKIALVTMHNKISLWNKELGMLEEVECEEKCILYSAHIAYSNINSLIVLSGTVFSDILIWKPFCTPKNEFKVIERLRAHKGVIFSIDCDEKNGLICTTSDDRSAILWKIKNNNFLEAINKNTLEISILSKVYGHLSRVFRCKILENSFATTGEDGKIIIWNFEGKINRKIESHQPGPIWCLDYQKQSNTMVTGGSDSGIVTFKLDTEIHHTKLNLPDKNPKFVAILNSGNIVLFSELAALYYYNKKTDIWEKIAEYEDLKRYALFQVSLCKNMFALCGLEGQIYIFRENCEKLRLVVECQCPEKSRILSFHWLTCKLFLICQKNGHLTLFLLDKNTIVEINKFTLPVSKERWSTCACLLKNEYLVVGNRKSDIFLYRNKFRTPIDTIKKAHCHLGVVNIYNKGNFVVSLGRNGVLKKFHVTEDKLVLIESHKTKYSWLAAIENELLIAFSGNKFVLSDLQYKRTLFEFDCGGGHRSWSFLQKDDKVFFVFVKNKTINSVEVDVASIIPKDFVEGTHPKEINALKILEFENSRIFISGGEDTTLRLNILDNEENFVNAQCSKVHLSSIRAIEVLKLSETSKDYVIFSGGGRGQIISWSLSVTNNEDDKAQINCSEKYSLYEELDEELPEVRMMDLTVLKTNEEIVLFSGCSDGKIKVFTVEKNSFKLDLLTTLFHKYICIVKIQVFKILEKDCLISMATDGELVFWDVTNIFDCVEIKPFDFFQIHDSGINSFSHKFINSTDILILTGGDDNKVSFDLFQFEKNCDSLKTARSNAFFDKSVHCAQVTGTYIFENCFITSSIDQRIAVFSYNQTLKCVFLGKYNSSVADLQGMQCYSIGETLRIVVYGKGLEIVDFSSFF